MPLIQWYSTLFEKNIILETVRAPSTTAWRHPEGARPKGWKPRHLFVI